MPGSIGVPGAGIWLVTDAVAFEPGRQSDLGQHAQRFSRAQPAKIRKVAAPRHSVPTGTIDASRSLRAG